MLQTLLYSTRSSLTQCPLCPVFQSKHLFIQTQVPHCYALQKSCLSHPWISTQLLGSACTPNILHWSKNLLLVNNKVLPISSQWHFQQLWNYEQTNRQKCNDTYTTFFAQKFCRHDFFTQHAFVWADFFSFFSKALTRDKFFQLPQLCSF